MTNRLAPLLLPLALIACASPPHPEASLRPLAALPPPPPVGEPTGVVGLEEAQLRATFGQPAFVRKDGTAQMWRYDSPGCKAFFFLYPGSRTALAVRHVETLPRGTEMAADLSCLAALRNRSLSPVS